LFLQGTTEQGRSGRKAAPRLFFFSLPIEPITISAMAISQDQTWTVGRLLNWTSDYFKSKDMDEPLLSAQLLLAKVLNCSKVDLYLRFEQEVLPPQREEYRGLVKRAAEAEPIAYLIGHKEFFSLDFLVGPGVLIPRPETELLVQWVIRKVRSQPRDMTQILDLGTGSGCIAVALAKFLPGKKHILAVDKSPLAVPIAQKNAERNNVSNDLTLKIGDLFQGTEKSPPFDFIVSNPPYVTEEDYTRLPKHIKAYEPAEALLAGPDGLAVIEKIVPLAREFLKSEGYLAMEIGYNQRDAVKKLLEIQGYDEITFELDAADIPRIAIGKYRPH
jgi:release factor glutamine methyltransferase